MMEISTTTEDTTVDFVPFSHSVQTDATLDIKPTLFAGYFLGVANTGNFGVPIH